MNATASLLILGAGQYGQVAREVALAQGRFARIDFLDDRNPQAIGKLSELEHFDYDYAFVAIGNPHDREFWVDRIRQSSKLTLATLIHPSAIIMPSAQVGEGSIIEAGAVLSSNSRIGTACIIQANAVIGHDATVGDYCQIKYNSTVPERSTMPPHSKLEGNTLYQDQAYIDEFNRRFMESETAATGVTPSFF